MMHSMMWGMGLWSLLWTVIPLGVLALAVFGGVWLVRQLRGEHPHGEPTGIGSPGDPARDTLRRRYAAGEIDDEEYERRLAALDRW